MQLTVNHAQPLPLTSMDMVVKVSETGALFINQGKFKKRHYGTKDLYEKPNSVFASRSAYKLQFPKEFQKKACRRLSPDKSPAEPVPSPARCYRLAKSKVSSKLRTMYKAKGNSPKFFMWTVSFPINTADAVCYLLLNKWLTRLRRDENLGSYLWVAERQQNGTLHYHIAVHQYLNVKRCNRYMRACLFTCIEQKLISWSKSEAVKYNGVDIAKDRKTKRVINFAEKHKSKALAAYLTKYVTKNDSESPYLCWHCSRDYSNLVTSVAFTLAEFLQLHISSSLDRDQPLLMEWFRFYRWKGQPPDSITLYLSRLNQTLQQNFFPQQTSTAL